MLSAIWIIIKRLPWSYIGAAFAILALWYVAYTWAYNRGKHAQEAKDAPTIQRLKERGDGYLANQIKLTDALNRQNASIEALKTEGDKRVSDGKNALKQAENQNKALSDKIEALRKSAGRKVDDAKCPISETLQRVGSV